MRFDENGRQFENCSMKKINCVSKLLNCFCFIFDKNTRIWNWCMDRSTHMEGVNCVLLGSWQAKIPTLEIKVKDYVFISISRKWMQFIIIHVAISTWQTTINLEKYNKLLCAEVCLFDYYVDIWREEVKWKKQKFHFLIQFKFFAKFSITRSKVARCLRLRYKF